MLRSSRLLPVLAFAASLALAGSAPAIAKRTAAAAGGELTVSSSARGGTAYTTISLRAWAEVGARSAPTAAVSLTVPRGYDIDPRRPPGTEVGGALAFLEDASGGTGLPGIISGPLVADDPAGYLQNPEAQACAPGLHAAVWRVAQPDSSLRLLVFVDLAAEGSGHAYTLRLCPLWPPTASFPGGTTAPAVLLYLRDVAAPAATAVYTWSAVVTPADPGTLAPLTERAFELRAVVPRPHALTLRARHDPKTRTVVLSGRLAAAGRPVPGVSVGVVAYTGTYDFTEYGAVRTNAAGEFSLRRAIDRTTVFEATAYVPSRPCSAPSAAPGGCLGETVASPTEPRTSLRIPRATDPRRAIRKRDDALARRASLRRADFPAGWEAEDASPFSLCEAFQPNLADLTLTGEARSSQFLSEHAGATSTTAMYSTEGQAKTAFRRTARLEAAQCLARDLRDAEYKVLQVGTFDIPRLADEAKAFRVIADFRESIVYLDVVYVRGGRAVVELAIGSLTQPLLDEEELAAKVAARLG